jgi:hypothetical protein
MAVVRDREHPAAKRGATSVGGPESITGMERTEKNRRGGVFGAIDGGEAAVAVQVDRLPIAFVEPAEGIRMPDRCRNERIVVFDVLLGIPAVSAGHWFRPTRAIS